MADVSKQEEMSVLEQGEEGNLQRWGPETNKSQRHEGSVLLDVERLAFLVDHSNDAANTTPEAVATPQTPKKMMWQKSLTRKFSHRSERKAAPDGDNVHPTAAGGGRGGVPPPSIAAAGFAPLAAAPDQFVAVVLSPAPAPEATAASPWKAAPCRRAQGRRAAASWLDPRRVLLLFATLSSMGTIILLYFTLAMGKMGDGDANAR